MKHQHSSLRNSTREAANLGYIFYDCDAAAHVCLWALLRTSWCKAVDHYIRNRHSRDEAVKACRLVLAAKLGDPDCGMCNM